MMKCRTVVPYSWTDNDSVLGNTTSVFLFVSIVFKKEFPLHLFKKATYCFFFLSAWFFNCCMARTLHVFWIFDIYQINNLQIFFCILYVVLLFFATQNFKF